MPVGDYVRCYLLDEEEVKPEISLAPPFCLAGATGCTCRNPFWLFSSAASFAVLEYERCAALSVRGRCTGEGDGEGEGERERGCDSMSILVSSFFIPPF